MPSHSATPDPSAAANRKVQDVDQVGGKDPANRRRPTADADVPAVGEIHGEVERFAWRRVDEVELVQVANSSTS